MSRDWTPDEIQMVSKEMKAAGHMGYEEFCEALEEQQVKAATERDSLTAQTLPQAPQRCCNGGEKKQTS